MTSAVFYYDSGQLTGFRVSGHAGHARAGRDIVCAAVSACVELCCNAVTDILKLNAQVNVGDDSIELVLSAPHPSADLLLRALQLELEEIREKFPRNIRTEVISNPYRSGAAPDPT